MMKQELLTRQASKPHDEKRILLVEDHDVNRMLLSDYLTHFSYSVRSLSHAATFFPNLEQFRPNLVLLDLKLPEIDGYTLLEEIQQKPEWQNTPIFVISGFAFKADKQRALDLGARNYFVKPINLNHVRQAIEAELLV
jgi:two-component system, cell cycle response regulator DivK